MSDQIEVSLKTEMTIAKVNSTPQTNFIIQLRFIKINTKHMSDAKICQEIHILSPLSPSLFSSCKNVFSLTKTHPVSFKM